MAIKYFTWNNVKAALHGHWSRKLVRENNKEQRRGHIILKGPREQQSLVSDPYKALHYTSWTWAHSQNVFS